METLKIATKLGKLLTYMGANGFEIEEVTEPDKISQLVAQLDKPYLTPMSSPDHNDFTENNVICLVAKKNGKPAMMGCARLEDIGEETVGRYWSRVFARAYATKANEQIIGETHPKIEISLQRKLVYFGDLFVAQKTRGNRLPLRAFVAIGHLAAALKWDPDWIYCFIRERDILLGASAMYGFNRDFGPAFKWLGDPPHPRDHSEQLVAVDRLDIQMMTERTALAVEQSTSPYTINSEKFKIA